MRELSPSPAPLCLNEGSLPSPAAREMGEEFVGHEEDEDECFHRLA